MAALQNPEFFIQWIMSGCNIMYSGLHPLDSQTMDYSESGRVRH